MVLKSKTRASYLINLQLSPIEDLPAAQNNIGREAQLGSSRVEAELIEFLMMFNIIQPRNGVWQPQEEIQPTIRGKLTSNKRGFTVHETGWWVQFRLYIFNCSTIPNPFFVKRNIEIRNFYLFNIKNAMVSSHFSRYQSVEASCSLRGWMLYCGEGVPMNTQVRADDDDPKWAMGWTSMANLKTAIFDCQRLCF